MYSERKIAVVLSGGGAKGAYQVGVIRRLFSRVPRIDVLCGSSVGALHAAVLAEAFLSDDASILDRLERTWLNLYGVLTLDVRGLLRPLAAQSIFLNTRVRQLIHQCIPAGRSFSDYDVDLSVTAVNLNTGTASAFDRSSGAPVREALLASCAIPVVFPAVRIGRDYFVDGGTFNNTPLREAMVRGATDVIVVSMRPRFSPVHQQGISTYPGTRRPDGQLDVGLAGAAEQGPGPHVSSRRFDSALSAGARLFELALERLLYEDMRMALRVNELLRAVERVRAKDPDLAERMEKAAGLVKPGRTMRVVNVVEIAPQNELMPPGTLGFSDKRAIRNLIELGRADADAVIGGFLR
ncbi:MAG: patatin-like phospholipase family protein [Firmicutes bacterium]|jgi:NTE family protein|nr:patatin-like phospholipase family protein [Bacillota bacterium]